MIFVLYIHLEPLFLVVSWKIHAIFLGTRFTMDDSLLTIKKRNCTEAMDPNPKEIAEVVSKFEESVALWWL